MSNILPSSSSRARTRARTRGGGSGATQPKQGTYLRAPRTTSSRGAQRTGRVNGGQRHKGGKETERRGVFRWSPHIHSSRVSNTLVCQRERSLRAVVETKKAK